MVNKERVVIGSVLKPVNDPRMYEKLGNSLVRARRYEVHIAGFCTNKHSANTNITFYSLFCSSRLSWHRVGVPWKFFKLLLKVKPQVIIIETHEYLIVTCLYKILFGSKILYDVRENYLRNILYTNAFPVLVRWPLAMFVRSLEHLSRPLIDHYWLAEKCYAWELPFTKRKASVLENKYQPMKDTTVIPRRNRFNLFYSGTISRHYGVYEAIALAKKLHQSDTRYTLTIVGYAARKEDQEELRRLAQEYPFLRLVGIEKLVPHTEVVNWYKQAGVALLPYHPNKSTENCIPTKFYEYIFHQIPVVIPPNPRWENFYRSFGGFTAYDFNSLDAQVFMKIVIVNPFSKVIDKKALLWTNNTNLNSKY